MSEQFIDFIQAVIGIFIVFGAMGVGCAVWEIVVNAFENRKRKKAEKTKKRYIKWNN